MKNYSRLFRTVYVIFIFIMSSGCQKFMEYVQSHPTTELPGCQIRRFSIIQPYGGNPDTLTFAYNLWGDPISILRTNPNTGSPNFFFHYDKQHRLIESIGAYGNTTSERVESWNKYFYNESGRIIKDSLYFFPDIVDGHPILGEHGAVSILLFEYDTKDRVSSVIWYRGGIQPYIMTYAYDGNGNLAGPASYDDKINFRRTNKMWMFLDRNYSVNNPAAASYTYNQVGLPTTIDCLPGPGSYFDFMLTQSTPINFTHATIEYDCH